jgi:hypothetical protein
VVILFLRLLKRTPEARLAVEDAGDRPGADLPDGNGDGFAGQSPPGANNRLAFAYQRSAPPGVVTVETLNQLVRENPVSVSQAIQGWLNRAPVPQNEHGHTR